MQMRSCLVVADIVTPGRLIYHFPLSPRPATTLKTLSVHRDCIIYIFTCRHVVCAADRGNAHGKTEHRLNLGPQGKGMPCVPPRLKQPLRFFTALSTLRAKKRLLLHVLSSCRSIDFLSACRFPPDGSCRPTQEKDKMLLALLAIYMVEPVSVLLKILLRAVWPIVPALYTAEKLRNAAKSGGATSSHQAHPVLLHS